MNENYIKMIFHYPLPLDELWLSASRLRPIKMLEAFNKLGLEVFEISGYAKERKEKINLLKKRISQGEKFTFLYSEASTMPTLLTEKNHLPTYPFLDFDLFRICKKIGIKVGLFYRDIYWNFPDYGKNLGFLKKKLAKIFYLYDLVQYDRLVDVIYIPSMEMSKYIPFIRKAIFKDLPPGHSDYQVYPLRKPKDNLLKMIYVGGIGNHYRLHKLFNVVKNFSNLHLFVCVRFSDWEVVKKEYDLSGNIEILTDKKGRELEKIYEEVDIALLFVEPQIYRKFAVPFKLFEYIGKQKPIIATKETFAGDFVQKYNIGWVVDYQEETLNFLIRYLIENPQEIIEKQKNIISIKMEHTWMKRVQKVISDLCV